MLFYDDEIDLRGLEDIKFDAEKFSAFMDSLAQDIDGYTAKARNLVSGYGKYYHNETYGGRAADASKEFIANGQMDKLHVQNHNVQKDLFKACIDTKEAFEEMVDPSPKARISREALRQIKKDHQGRYEEMDMLGHEIEGMVREVMADFSDLTNFEYFDANPVREIYDEFSGNGGHVDKCIRKLEMFDEQAKAIMNQAGIIDKSELLQDNIRNTAGALDAMKVYNPSISKNSVGLVAFGANASYLDNGLASLWAAASNGTKMNVKFFASDKEAAEYLDSQMKVLCDDDNSNDEAAIVNINATIQGFLYMEVADGKKYVAYDQKKIEGTLKYLEKDGLAYQLLSSVNEQINRNKRKGVAIPNAITELGVGGRFENTKFEARKDGAGVRLEITSNNDLLPLNEIKHKPVAYAATEESAKNYFMNGKTYDWKAIDAWYKAGDECNDNYHLKSIEYDVLAYEMNNMTDSDISQLINSAVYWKDPACMVNVVSDKLDILSERYMLQMQELRVMGSDVQKEVLGYSGKDFENKYTRAVLVRNVNNRLQVLPPTNTYYVDISYERSEFAQTEYDENVPVDTYGDRDYTANIHTITSPIFPNAVEVAKGVQIITVNPYSGYAEIQDNIGKQVGVTINSMATPAPKEIKSFVFSQTNGYLIGKVNTPSYFAYAIGEEMLSLCDAYESEAKAQGTNGALEQIPAVHSMMIEGATVHISGAGVETIYVYEPAFNDKQLVINVAAYNEQNKTHYTIEQMKKEYADNSNVFKKYNDWYTRSESKGHVQEYRDKIRDEIGGDKFDGMDAKELEEYLVG